ncbi:membrane protein [Pandoraea terrae]|uniref:Membrane protein n=1 Tax=Pandoraea terrae TaxID=1537710 RepID=A0A5E4XUY3_9BURK|nr:DUF4149 domain-containing protein [Pandoraea terrae]VVE40189.1 membrane protein [Pandoraea terrae]
MSATSDTTLATRSAQRPERVFRLLATVWCGSQWAIGYLVAPTLFAVLESRAVAGSVAGHLFRTQAWLGLVCGVILLLLANSLVRRSVDGYRGLRWLVLGMLACVLVGYFALQPWMAQLRAAAEAAGTEVGHSPQAARFGMLHGVSSGFYLLQSLLGLALIWRQPVRG